MSRLLLVALPENSWVRPDLVMRVDAWPETKGKTGAFLSAPSDPESSRVVMRLKDGTSVTWRYDSFEAAKKAAADLVDLINRALTNHPKGEPP